METILVVDDDDDTRCTLHDMLEPAGYRILEAPTVATAREILASETIDLIVLDILMPGTDGTAFLREQEGLGRAGRPPVLVATSLSEMALMRDCMRHGAADFINKPVSIRGLREAVARVLERARSAPPGPVAPRIEPPPRPNRGTVHLQKLVDSMRELLPGALEDVAGLPVDGGHKRLARRLAELELLLEELEELTAPKARG